KFLKNLYFRLETEREPELAQLMLEIQKKAEDFFLHRTGPAEIEMEFGQTQSLGREKEDLKLLKTVLLYRAIALLHTKKSPDGWINFGHYEQFDPKKDLKYSDLHEGYGDLFDPRLADDHKKYFVTQLGFSGHWENTERNTRTNCVWVQVATDKMFKAERDWYDTLDIVHLTEKPLQEEMPAFFKALLCLVEKIAKIPDVARDLLVKILHLNDLRKSQLEDFWEDLLDAGDSIDHQSWPSIERELAALIRPNLPPKPPKTP
ncbi:MAG: hypothetical protein ABIQ93_13945, partial [Saprospiraceae bacterium]